MEEGKKQIKELGNSWIKLSTLKLVNQVIKSIQMIGEVSYLRKIFGKTDQWLKGYWGSLYTQTAHFLETNYVFNSVTQEACPKFFSTL